MRWLLQVSSYFFLCCFGANQIIKRTQGRFRTFARGNDDLFVRHGRTVTCGEDAFYAGFTFRINDDLAHTVALNRAFQPGGVWQQTNLHEDP